MTRVFYIYLRPRIIDLNGAPSRLPRKLTRDELARFGFSGEPEIVEVRAFPPLPYDPDTCSLHIEEIGVEWADWEMGRSGTIEVWRGK
jgi:hypothetical protein